MKAEFTGTSGKPKGHSMTWVHSQKYIVDRGGGSLLFASTVCLPTKKTKSVSAFGIWHINEIMRHSNVCN